MKEEKKLYNCSYELLYIICKLGWGYCSQHLEEFAKFRAKYSAAFIASALTAVNEAESIEDVDVRNAQGKKATIALEAAIRLVCNNWQELKRYISIASSPADEAVNLQLAGFNHYQKAQRGKWEAAGALIKNANDYINQNLAMLQADDNMPDTFAGQFKTDGDDCAQIAAKRLDIKRKKPIYAKSKVSANNDIYNELMIMFADSQRVFFDDEKIRRQFTVSYLTELANGTRAGSIRGAVVDAFTGKPVENAVVTIASENYNGKSNNKGRYSIKKVAAGNYTMLVEAPYYQPVSMPITVKTGTASTNNVSLALAESALKVA